MADLIVRQADAADAAGMCTVLNPIIAAGGTTAHRTPFDEARMRKHYIAPPLNISCCVAVGEDGLLGFQSLVRPDPDHGGAVVLSDGWGIIATFVAREAHGRGVGKHLFAATLEMARAAGLRSIDATIRHENTGGHAFYGRLGFVPYRESETAVSRRFDL